MKSKLKLIAHAVIDKGNNNNNNFPEIAQHTLFNSAIIIKYCF